MNRAAAITLGWIVGCASFASAGVYAPVAEGGASRAILIVGDKASLPKLEVWPGSSQPRTPGTWGQTEYFPYIDVVNRWNEYLQSLAGGPPPVKGNMLFSDDFSAYTEGADGRPTWKVATDAAAGRPRPQWMVERGAMGVDIPGEGGVVAAATGLLLCGEPKWKNYSVQARVKLVRTGSGAASVGIRLRLTDDDRPGSQGGYALRIGTLQSEFGWLSGGQFKPLQSVPVTTPLNAWQTVRIDCLNYNFRVWINGKLLLGADDWYGPRTGRVALEIRDAQAAFDDVVVTQID